MSATPRLLPVIAVAIGGVLAIKGLTSAGDLPKAMSGAKAFAQDVVSGAKAAKPLPSDGNAPGPADKVPDQPGLDRIRLAAQGPVTGIQLPKAGTVCAVSAEALAKEAGLSQAELKVLQSLGSRRGQLDQREKSIDLQLQLLAVAENKLDGKLKTMQALKTQVAALIKQAENQQDAEIARLIVIYETMKPKDAASRMALMDDSVRVPIAAQMKAPILSAILAKMAPEEAKALTEKLANRFVAAKVIKDARDAMAQPPATPGSGPGLAKPQNAPKVQKG
jgi:flagellar motility protein MotE (MotC chaperone)